MRREREGGEREGGGERDVMHAVETLTPAVLEEMKTHMILAPHCTRIKGMELELTCKGIHSITKILKVKQEVWFPI